MSEDSDQKPRGKSIWVLLNIVSTIFWSYVFLQVFVIDVDYKTAEYFAPGYVWLLSLKALVPLVSISLSLLFVGKWKTLGYIGYMAFYPLILVLIKLPYFLFKQKSWIIAFSIVNSTIVIINSFVRNIVLFVVYAGSLSIVMFSKSEEANILVVVLVLLCICYSFIFKFIGVFRTTPVFKFYRRVVELLKVQVDKNFTLSDELKVPPASLTAENLEKWRNSLYASVLQNRLCLFLATKLRDYQNSGLGIISEIISTIYLFIVTIFAFTIINIGLYNFYNDEFIISSNDSFFQFFYYSFNTFVFNSISEIAPHDPISQAISIVEKFFALMLIAIFTSLLIAVRSQRSSKEVDDLITLLGQQSRQGELIIRKDYKVNISEALAELERWRSGTTKMFLLISNDLGQNLEDNAGSGEEIDSK